MRKRAYKKADTKSFLDEIDRRQKASRRGKNRRSSAKTGEKGHHPSVKIIPATKSPRQSDFWWEKQKHELYWRNVHIFA